jgi:hypothetical protein
VVHKYKEQEVYNTQHHHQLEDTYSVLSHDVAAAVVEQYIWSSQKVVVVVEELHMKDNQK